MAGTADAAAELTDGSLDRHRVSLVTIAREWGRIGCIGFGGPPAHIALLRELCVKRRVARGDEFEDGIAATNLLPGAGVDPTGDLLRVAAARRRRRGDRRAVLHRARADRSSSRCCLVPRRASAACVRGAAAGTGAAVAAVAVQRGAGPVPGQLEACAHGQAGPDPLDLLRRRRRRVALR